MDPEEQTYAAARKKVWAIYAAITASIVIILVTVVARDLEEQLFFGGFFAAAFYIFRPHEPSIQAAVKKWFDIDPPANGEEPPSD